MNIARRPVLLQGGHYLKCAVTHAHLCAPFSRKMTNLAVVKSPSSWHPSTVPDPTKLPHLTGRPGVVCSRVCDPDTILSDDTKDAIEGRIKRSVSDMAAVILSKMDAKFIKSCGGKEEASRQFAVRLHNQWGIGDRARNDGVLLFISLKDRVVFVSTGDGIKDRIDASVIQGVISNMRPLLRKEEYDAAIEKAIYTITDLVDGNVSPEEFLAGVGESNSSQDEENSMEWKFFYGVLAAVLIGLGIPWLFEYVNNRREEIARLEAESAMEEVFATDDISCPRCLMRYNNKEDRGRVALQCGHSFCCRCYQQQLQFNEKCCICEKDMEVRYPDEVEDVNAMEAEEEERHRAFRYRVSRYDHHHGRVTPSDQRERMRYYADHSTPFDVAREEMRKMREQERMKREKKAREDLEKRLAKLREEVICMS